MPRQHWLLYVRSIGLALRSVLFDQYPLFIKIFWTLFITVLVLIGSVISVWISLSIFLIGLSLYRSLFSLAMERKYWLIRTGDTIEYALPKGATPIQQFAKRKIRYRLSQKELASTTLFDPEMIEFYEHFFLIDENGKNVPIAFEWISSIEIEEENLLL